MHYAIHPIDKGGGNHRKEMSSIKEARRRGKGMEMEMIWLNGRGPERSTSFLWACKPW